MFDGKFGITKQTILCGLMVGFWMLAAPSQAEDLRAYYAKQKAEIATTFTGPETGSEITVVLLNGEERTGVVKQLTENGVQLLSDEALVTFKKHELNEASCARLFAEDYAHAMAIKRTRAYKQAQSKAGPVTHQGSLSVSAKTERDSDTKTVSKEKEEGTLDKITTTKTQVQNLTLTVANRTKRADTYSLEWYFFAQPEDEDSVKVHSRGSKELKLGANQKVTQKIASDAVVSKKVVTNWLACCGKATSDEETTGLDVKGYLVVLKCGGEVLDRKASSKRYLDPDWVKLCR